MIERIVLVKLNDVYAGERNEIAAFAQSQLAQVPQVRALSVGVPADEKARVAWDLSIVLRFDSLRAMEAYIGHPIHRSLVDGYLAHRMVMLKVWNFEPQSPDAALRSARHLKPDPS